MISEVAVEVAAQFNCEVVAHGSTGKGNDQVRFEGYILTLNPKLKIIAPVREWGMGRDEEIEYAQQHGIPIKQKADVPYSWDENVWSNTGEGGEIENPELKPKLERILQWTKEIEKAEAEPEIVEIEFEKGIPVALNGKRDTLYSIIAALNQIGGKHGVGVTQLIEDRVVGLKVRGVYENPGAAILIAAHKKLEYLVSTREENEFSSIIHNKWSYLVYGAKWFDPLMRHLQAYIDHQNEKVTGKTFVKLYRGNIIVESLSSPYSLFNHNLATFNRSAAFNQNASPGFIELYTLAMRTAYGLQQTSKQNEQKKQ
jgi:argininosuccinate synthase